MRRAWHRSTRVVLRSSADGLRLAILIRYQPTPGADAVAVLVSQDGGANFSAPVVLHSSSFVGDLDLELEDDELHVVWQEDPAGFGLPELRYQFSDDGGQTWLPTAVDIGNGTPSDRRDIDLAVRGDRLAVVFSEISALCAVSTVMSVDGGQTWSGPVRVGGFSPGCMDRAPRAFHTPTHLVVTWTDDRTGAPRPYISWTANGGQTWAEELLFVTYGRDVQLAGDPRTGTFAAFWDGSTQLYAKWSTPFTPNPDLALTVEATNFVDFEDLRLRYDPVYNHFLCSWRRVENGGAENLWVAGFRAAQLDAIGPFQPGSNNAFNASGFPQTEIGDGIQVLVSTAPGAAVLPAGDGRSLGLGPSVALTASSTSPAFRTQVGAFGGGATGQILLPPSVPSGTVLHFLAVSFRTSPLRFGTMTDTATLVVQ